MTDPSMTRAIVTCGRSPLARRLRKHRLDSDMRAGPPQRRHLVPAVLVAVLAVSPPSAAGEQQRGEVEGKKTAIAPLVLSNPTLGAGGGFSLSYLYRRRPEDPVSQIRCSAAYTDTDSLVAGVFNSGRYGGDRHRISTGLGYGDVNKDFSGAEVGVETRGIFHQHKVRIAPKQYLGLQVVYIETTYEAQNRAGEQFLELADVEDTTSVPLSLVYDYDTRDNHFFPTTGLLAALKVEAAFEDFGSDQSYEAFELNLRRYWPLHEHVIAAQIYGRYTGDDTAYANLSYLGRRNVLRGFTSGEIAGERLTAIQVEYRHFFTQKWKGVAFAGLAEMGGDTAELTGDDGTYSTAGLGVRYAIQPEQGVHLRLDLAFGSDENRGFYVSIVEAF